MYIFLIIIGSIILLFSGLIWLAAYLATKNQKNWDSFISSFQKSWAEKERNENVSLPEIPEETLYNMVLKIRNISSFICMISLVIAGAGIALQITVK